GDAVEAVSPPPAAAGVEQEEGEDGDAESVGEEISPPRVRTAVRRLRRDAGVRGPGKRKRQTTANELRDYGPHRHRWNRRTPHVSCVCCVGEGMESLRSQKNVLAATFYSAPPSTAITLPPLVGNESFTQILVCLRP
ncbi:unnamed protein product, partial [Ectocarpus sp. 13 AM-2016]